MTAGDEGWRPGRMKFNSLTNNADKYKARSAAAQSRRFMHCIDGAMYTTAQVAERLGVTRHRAGEILRTMPEARSWERLEGRPGAARRKAVT